MCFVRPIFKHVPLLLDSGGIQGSKVLFHFENMRLKVNGFVEMVKGLVAWLLWGVLSWFYARLQIETSKGRLEETEYRGVWAMRLKLLTEKFTFSVFPISEGVISSPLS